jgi:alpha-L-rhamnosidase
MAIMPVAITNLRAEHQAQAFGIDCVTPRLSWVIAQAPAGWQQAGYEIARCAADGTVLESAVRQSSDSVLVAWPFAVLSARQQVFVQVRVWGADQHHSEWSDRLPIEIGLLSPADWSAQFISPDWDEDTSAPQPAPLLRKPLRSMASAMPRFRVGLANCSRAICVRWSAIVILSAPVGLNAPIR